MPRNPERKQIPVAEPALVGNERRYVEDCLTSNWISSSGKYIPLFERALADLVQAEHGVATFNGTVALHLALEAIGVGPGDEVIVPSLTYVASANAVTYCGAKPVFVDVERGTWNIDPADVSRKLTRKTKAIMPVHLYGAPCNMHAITDIATRGRVDVVEDAAEALGATFEGRPVGAIGRVGIFSFFGNKIITTGEGGMVVTSDPSLAERLRQLRSQGQDPNRRYWFPVRGYNYRMTNIQAAIGLAQLERIDWHLTRRREIAAHYQTRLRQSPLLTFQEEGQHGRSVYWMVSILLAEDIGDHRDAIIQEMAAAGIETRPLFYPVHSLPMYVSSGVDLPNTDSLARRGICLPSGARLKEEEIEYVCQELLRLLEDVAEPSN